MAADQETGYTSPVLTRVRFVASPEAGQRVLVEFKDPQPRLAVASSLPLEALASPPEGRRDDELLVLLVAAGAARDAPWRRQARAWLECPGPTGVPPVEVGVEGVSVKWRPGRAVLEAPADRLDPMLLAVVDFAFHEYELHRLEAEIAAGWSTAQADVPLMGRVGKAELAREAAVANRSAEVALRRLRCARLEPRLLAPPAALGRAARQLGERLRTESDTETRLETLDGQIEVYEYVYELACQRISDYRHFRREYTVEILIAVILAIEALLVAYEISAYMYD
jgi:hypothetical protein